MGVDENLLAAFGVLKGEKAQIGKPCLQGIAQPHRDHVMAAGQLRQRFFPARTGDEIGHDEDQRAPPDHARGVGKNAFKVGAVGVSGIAVARERVQQHQQLPPPARAGIMRSTAPENKSAPVRLPLLDRKRHIRV